MNVGVILASGIGKRMEAGKNKVFLELQNKPLLFYSLKTFEKCPDIDAILVVVKEEEIKIVHQLIKKFRLKKIMEVIPGGKERQFSGLNAVLFLDSILQDKKKSLVAFHNGANPFVTIEEISATLSNAKKYGACAIAHPTKDTIKEVDKKGMVKRTLERSKLWNMQTPQTIKFPLAFGAFTQASKDNFIGTDDVSLVERLRKKVKIIEGSKYNFKITTPLDLALAKIIIKSLKI